MIFNFLIIFWTKLHCYYWTPVASHFFHRSYREATLFNHRDHKVFTQRPRSRTVFFVTPFFVYFVVHLLLNNVLNAQVSDTTNDDSNNSRLHNHQYFKELFVLSKSLNLSFPSEAEDLGYMSNTSACLFKYSFSTNSSPGSRYSKSLSLLWKPLLSLMIATLALRTNSIRP